MKIFVVYYVYYFIIVLPFHLKSELKKHVYNQPNLPNNPKRTLD